MIPPPLHFEADTFNELYSTAYEAIKAYGTLTYPRGLPCVELIAPQLILRNPKACLITLKARKLNYAYAIVEKLMYASGRSDPMVICAYNQRMKAYLNPLTGQFDGAYGLRIHDGDQLTWCFRKLKEDPDSRQAVITIHDFRDCRVTLDPACTLSLQFLIRTGQLHLIVTMRSNDLLWGTCLDVQAFSFLQELMAYWLGLPMGTYIHQPASLHYYLDRAPQLEASLADGEVTDAEVLPPWDLPWDQHAMMLDAFWAEEANLRAGVPIRWDHLHASEALTTYLRRLERFWVQKRLTAQPSNSTV